MAVHISRSVGSGDAMRILLIEDDQCFLPGVEPTLKEISGAAENLTIVKSRDSTIAAIDAVTSRNEFYDIFILDLSIPTIDGKADDEVDHGMTVFYYLEHYAPRTPIFILTGSDVNPIVNKLLSHAEQVDVWGNRRRIPTVQVKSKMDLLSFFDELRSVADCIAETDDIEIVARNLTLTSQQRRVFRVFARRRDSRSCEVSTLAGGLSSSQVFRVTARSASGDIQIVVAAKIADITAVNDEHERFDRHLKRLKAGAYPSRIEEIRSGAGLTAGVFYWLLNADSRSLFSLLAVDSERAAKVVEKVQNLAIDWIAGEVTTEVADIRRRLVKDEEANDLVSRYGLAWTKEFEKKSIQTKRACLHGDLHGGNILVDRNGTPLLIDFSEVGPGVASIDPITLELSLLFHPNFQEIRGSWPSIDTAAMWPVYSRYIQNCPCPAFVEACRNWCYDVAAGDREIYASAYTYLLLQLTYPQTDRKLIFSLLDAVRRSFLDSYN